MYKGAEICPSIAYSTLWNGIPLGWRQRLGSPNNAYLGRSAGVRSVLSKRNVLTWRERVQRSVIHKLKKPLYARTLSTSRFDDKPGNRTNVRSSLPLDRQRGAVVTLRKMLIVGIAHAMDPIQRAGQTAEANERGAMRYGRVAKNGRGRKVVLKSILSMLIKLFLALIIPTMIHSDFITDCIIKSIKARFAPSPKRKKRARKKGILSSRCNGVLCFSR